MEKTTLFVIGTPIGNMEDITLRAIRILNEVDVILCEDTRTTGKLLKHHNINSGRLISYHSKSSLSKQGSIIELLKEGKNMALVSDAGTPAISDPGMMLVKAIYEENLGNVDIVAVPGPSALISALSISGISAIPFLFLGFIPHKKGRQKIFSQISESKQTVVFYESPHRIEKTVESLALILDPKREIVIAKEITKMHEEVIKGNVEYVLSFLKNNPDKIKGEFVVIVGAS